MSLIGISMKRLLELYKARSKRCALLLVAFILLFTVPSVRVFFVMILASAPEKYQQKIGELGLYSDPKVIRYAVGRLKGNSRRTIYNICEYTTNTNCLAEVLMDRFPADPGLE